MCDSDTTIEVVQINFPEGCNIILGQSHFIKTVEDIYEAIAGTVPGGKFGIAFAEASGPCLVRSDGTDIELKEIAEKNILKLGCGHSFLIVLGNLFPIQVLDRIRSVPEICRIFCATANPVQVLIFRTTQGAGILGVVDGSPPTAVETDQDVESRIEMLKRFGYKR